MTCIIAIETATEACSAALLVQQDDETKIYKRFQLAPREHTKLILPMLDEVLAEADLKKSDIDAIAFGRGPGAFTGLRIATGIAQGLALSVEKPTIPVSSLHAMALTALNEISDDDGFQSVLVAIDARMDEVYWAEYSIIDRKLEVLGDEQLSAPQIMFDKTQSLSNKQKTALIGSGWDVYFPTYKDQYSGIDNMRLIPQKFPDAGKIAKLALVEFAKGEFQSVEEAQPVYLRNNVAEKSKKQI